MILLDYSAISIASLAANMMSERKTSIELDYGQHIVLNSIKHYISLFNGKFGETLICCDSARGSWRRDAFPHYKAARKANREKSEFDWGSIFAVADSVKRGLIDNFPVTIVEQDKYEADDLIAAFAMYAPKPIVICSEDKDFYQLLQYPDVYIYHNKKREFYVSNEIVRTDIFEYFKKVYSRFKIIQVEKGFGKQYLIDHIISGDTADGIPNILSDDDTFIVEEKRQKPITKKIRETLRNKIKNGELPINYDRNMNLISLEVPSCKLQDYVQEVLVKGKSGVNVFTTQQWLMSQGLVNLAKNVQDFYPTTR